MAQHTKVHCKLATRHNLDRTVIFQCNRTEGRWRNPASGPAHVHTPADNPDLSGGQRAGQRWNQVCSQALAATSGQLKVRNDLRAPQHWPGVV